MTAAPAVAPEKAHAARAFDHKAPLIACRFDPKGRFAFASSEDQSVLRWDLGSEDGPTPWPLRHY